MRGLIILFVSLCISAYSNVSPTDLPPGTYPVPGEKDLWVSPSGKDTNPGTKEAPFKTIQQAADSVQPGQTVFISGGTYRETVTLETSGRPDKPVRFAAVPGEWVEINGTLPVQGTWKLKSGQIYQIKLSRNLIKQFKKSLPERYVNMDYDFNRGQLFVDRKPMDVARWPNRPAGREFVQSDWATVDPNSIYGTLKSRALAETGIDWNGATVWLNIGHQFYTWSRTVENYKPGSDTLSYPKDMKSLSAWLDWKNVPWWRQAWFADDYFFLTGKLEALDQPGEWYFDPVTDTLYFWPLDGKSPENKTVEFKTTTWGLIGSGISYNEFYGINFFACTQKIEDSLHLVFDGITQHYPLAIVESHEDLGEPALNNLWPLCGSVSGENIIIRNSTFAYSEGGGIRLRGTDNLFENNHVHDTAYLGSLSDVPVLLENWKITEDNNFSELNTARYNTLYNSGSTGLFVRRGVAEYNHLYNTGLTSRDVEILRTSTPVSRNSEFHHNWIHGCTTPGFRGIPNAGGTGIRGDDASRNITIHHNVIWDCGAQGIITKGFEHRVFNNTIFDIGAGNPTYPGGFGLTFPDEPEPEKWWPEARKKLFPEEMISEPQNYNSIAERNALNGVFSNNKGYPYEGPAKIDNNYTGTELKLRDPENYDFRPADDSPLITKNGVIGAYDPAEPRWVPGMRNILWLLPAETKGKIKVGLRIEPVHPVTINVGTSQISFTRENWNIFQTVAVSDSIRIQNDELGLDQTVQLSAIPEFSGRQLMFRSEK